jgi:hypothetical protein
MQWPCFISPWTFVSVLGSLPSSERSFCIWDWVDFVRTPADHWFTGGGGILGEAAWTDGWRRDGDHFNIYCFEGSNGLKYEGFDALLLLLLLLLADVPSPSVGIIVATRKVPLCISAGTRAQSKAMRSHCAPIVIPRASETRPRAIATSKVPLSASAWTFSRPS